MELEERTKQMELEEHTKQVEHEERTKQMKLTNELKAMEFREKELEVELRKLDIISFARERMNRQPLATGNIDDFPIVTAGEDLETYQY